MDAKRKQKIDDFFDSIVDEKDFAKSTRRFVHETIKMTMILDENYYKPDKKWINDGFNLLNDLCEILDPNLEVENLKIDD